MNRTAQVKRNTKETKINCELCLDGGAVEISTGVGFFDHMLNAFAHHGGFGLKLKVDGDLYVDCHHTIEDTGIVLGMAIKEALGDRAGIMRFGNSFIPMDESLAFCALDVSGRPFLVFDGEFPEERCGDYDTCMTEEFFRAVAFNAGITLHIKCEYGKNSHHMIEAMYKAFAYALKAAVKSNGTGEVISTKGVL
ncbi:MAG: imidazoleglycerol-phosphate dehydratase HisB [Clostridia bacterium]|nr:imidazoleglycerol-phosphate dehydratase HisB [Clostridia bacterium]